MLEFKGIDFAADLTARVGKMFGQAQNYVDREVVNRLEHYTPVAKEKYPNHGKMSKSHKVESPGVIINTEPTARKEYYTNKGSSGQGKLWLERMKADHAEDILKGIKK